MKLWSILLVTFLLSSCASIPSPGVKPDLPAPVAEESAGITFDMEKGSVVLHSEGQEKLLGQILKNGQLELASDVTGNDFALAVLIMIKSRIGENWEKISQGLPR